MPSECMLAYSKASQSPCTSLSDVPTYSQSPCARLSDVPIPSLHIPASLILSSYVSSLHVPASLMYPPMHFKLALIYDFSPVKL